MKQELITHQELFKNAAILDCDHTPETVHFRERQLAELAFRVRPGLNGFRPVTTLCRGLPGTGKTACIHHLFTEIEKTTKRLVPVYVNCRTDQTKYQVFSTIYTKLLGHAPPRTGIPARRLMDAIAKVMVDREIILLVCLDDLCHLIHAGTQTAILSSLTRMYLDYPGCRIGLILTMSDQDTDLADLIEGSVYSGLLPEEIFFPPYSGDEIRTILSDRVKGAIRPDALSPEMLDLIVSETQKGADIRIGLALLQRSLLSADRAGRRSVEREDIVSSSGDARLLRLRETIRILSAKERRILPIIATLPERPVPTSGQVYAIVRDREEISYTTFYERLKTLAHLGLLELSIRQRKGRTSEIRLRYEADEVMGICAGMEEERG
ncbi:hypothetical protein RJ53_09315 [Methanocalculus chunghsingensis]|uniref:ORC1-type DNA replication protein n=1 Tax=Methanocalculus chunghsingensis TaxID=156457 RepID=A0A8J7W785_9EURY|nr:ORC1-type DNA replication protein [Methanocalculus chunghsingensis]MBR1369661.1 hypothetical protein [Methanocalculus chunghsingensis]